MRSTLWLAAGMLLLTLACNKDEDSSSNCEKLVGKVGGTSWKEDDEQFFGDTIFIISSVIEFKTQTERQGDFDWKINYTLGGFTGCLRIVCRQ
jgi:hypothetical protein